MVVNETLLYKSRSDICAYQGGFPSGISDALGEELYSDAVAGAIRDRYYISMKDSKREPQLFVYDMGKTPVDARGQLGGRQLRAGGR